MPSYLVTGASRGLGYAFINHLSSNPSNTVIGLVRSAPATEARLAKDGLSRENLHIIQVRDVTDFAALREAAARTEEITAGAGLDVLIHNAARVVQEKDYGGVEEAEEDLATVSAELTRHFDTNVNGVLITTTAFLPLIRKSEIRKVIAITTGMADVDLVLQHDVFNSAAYSISKAALNMLMAKYHARYGKSEKILFLSISPGVVDTAEGTTDYTEAGMQNIQKMMGKFAVAAPEWKGPITPEQSAEMVLKVVENADVEGFGGGFVSHAGNKEWLQNYE